MSVLSQLIKRILPEKLVSIIRRLTLKLYMLHAYYYDLKRYFVYSSSKGFYSEDQLIGKIILEYHVIEKGLTMPETRLGFGREKILSLCNNCIDFIGKYKNEDVQLKHAIGVICEYKYYHEKNKFKLDEEILSGIEMLEKINGGTILHTDQKEINKEMYFSHTYDSFYDFSNSRSSVRNYSSEAISEEKIISAISLVTNTPSACNRQPWRTYIYTQKDQINLILEAQGGNRGFGHLTDKLIIITGELGLFGSLSERNQVFVDGGMYAMNLLYSLHYHQIAACILNCSHSVEKDMMLRKLCKIKESEVFIAMITCGIPPDNFKIAISKRYDVHKTNVIR